MAKGEAGFKAISYRGRPISRDYIDQSVTTVNVGHFRRMSASSLFDASPPPGRHACLFLGYWCWQNFREHPFDIKRYLQLKWRRHHAPN